MAFLRACGRWRRVGGAGREGDEGEMKGNRMRGAVSREFLEILRPDFSGVLAQLLFEGFPLLFLAKVLLLDEHAFIILLQAADLHLVIHFLHEHDFRLPLAEFCRRLLPPPLTRLALPVDSSPALPAVHCLISAKIF